MIYTFKAIRAENVTPSEECYLTAGIVTVDGSDELDIDFTACGSFSDEARATLVFAETGEIAGLHTYDLVKGTLFSQATWVSANHRRQGLATKMWEQSLKKSKPKKVSVSCISVGSVALIHQLSERYSKIDWQIYDCQPMADKLVAA